MAMTKQGSKEDAGGKSSKDETLKEKYAELRMASAQIKQLQQQLEAVEEKRQELETAAESLDSLKSAQKKTKLLAPVTEGIFASATLDDTEELIVNVGSNVCVKKTIDEAKALLTAKQQELLGYQESILEELNKLTDHAQALERELGQLLQEEEQAGQGKQA